MANRLKFRSGQVELLKLKVDAATVIEAGDLVYLDTDDVKPASQFPWTTDLATTSANFANVFLGVAHQSSAANEVADVSVDVSPLSIYEYDVVSASYMVGQAMGPNGVSNKLTNQQLKSVASSTQAIGRAVEVKTNATSLRMSFASAYAVASSNINAAVG